MSLLNEVLKDLDARQASAGAGQALPGAVRPLPARANSRRAWGVAALFATIAIAAAATFVLWRQPDPAVAPAAEAGTVASSPPQNPSGNPSGNTPDAIATAQPGAVPSVAAPSAAVVASVADVPSPEVAAAPAEPAAVAAQRPPAAMPRVDEVPPAADRVPARPSASAAGAGAGNSPQGGKSRAPQPVPAQAAAPGARPVDKADGQQKTAIERSDVAATGVERVDADYRKAVNALNQGRVAEAIDGLRGVLRVDPLQRAARQLLVKMLLEAGRTDEAIDVLREGLRGQPAQIAWAMALARLQVDRGELSAAWTTLDESLPAAGNNADYQGFAGNVLQRLGRSREAIARFQAALRLAPGDGRWWLGLGVAHDAEGNVGEAREAFLHARQAGNLSPELMALLEKKLR